MALPLTALPNARGSTPFFIVGTGRCGSTILRNLIREHPDVYVPRETHWIPILHHAFGMREAPHEDLLRTAERVYMARGMTAIERMMNEHKLDQKAFRRELLARLPGRGACTVRAFMEAFYGFLAEIHGRSITGDKTPDYGMCMTLIQSIWPDARFVHAYRDGRDTALSMSKVLSFRLLAAWGINHWWAIAWERAYERGLEDAAEDIPMERFYELWRSRITRVHDEADRLRPGTCLNVAYEQLLSAPASVLADVASFLALPARDAWIDRAAAMIRPENAGRNAGDPDYERLTKTFGAELEAMGFAV